MCRVQMKQPRRPQNQNLRLQTRTPQASTPAATAQGTSRLPLFAGIQSRLMSRTLIQDLGPPPACGSCEVPVLKTRICISHCVSIYLIRKAPASPCEGSPVSTACFPPKHQNTQTVAWAQSSGISPKSRALLPGGCQDHDRPAPTGTGTFHFFLRKREHLVPSCMRPHICSQDSVPLPTCAR